jgi:hypothetical protein
LCHYRWWKGRFRNSDDLTISEIITLSEGKKVELPIKVHRIGHLDKVARVYVVDQTLRRWRVKWPCRRELEVYTRNYLLENIEKKYEGRGCSAKGYAIGKKYCIFTKWSVEGIKRTGPSGRTFSFYDKKQYDDKLYEIVSKQIPEFIAGTNNEIT